MAKTEFTVLKTCTKCGVEKLLRSICNQQKHAKHPVDFMQSRGFLL